jgi:hypothetical protein
MATIGLPGDVTNSIWMQSAYPVGRTYGSVPAAATDFTYRNNYAGELGGLNQDYRGTMQAQTTNARDSGVPASVQQRHAENGTKPATWFIALFIGFIIFAWVARKYAPDGESYALIKPNIINGVFLTLWIVLILALMKQIAARVRVPGLSDLILSV